MTIEKFYNNVNRNATPILIFLAASFLAVFIHGVKMSIIAYILFLVETMALFKTSILKKTALISGVVILLIVFFNLLLSFTFNTNAILQFLPKALTSSILVSSAVIVFLLLPTYQLYCLISKAKSHKITIAVLTGFRTFTVFFDFTKKTYIALKLRKSNSVFHYFNLFITNIIIEFLSFVDEYIKRLNFITFEKKKYKFKADQCFIITVIYLVSIILLAYGN